MKTIIGKKKKNIEDVTVSIGAWSLAKSNWSVI